MAIQNSIPRYYDPASVELHIGGVAPTDVAADTMYVVSKEEDRVLPVAGVLGEVAIARNRNQLGTLTISLKQTSPMNEVLMNWMTASAAGVFMFPVRLLDPASGIIMNTTGWIQTQPELSLGKEVGQLDWVIGLANCEFVRWTGSTTIIDSIKASTPL